jgi:hypothetical protein
MKQHLIFFFQRRPTVHRSLRPASLHHVCFGLCFVIPVRFQASLVQPTTSPLRSLSSFSTVLECYASSLPTDSTSQHPWLDGDNHNHPEIPSSNPASVPIGSPPAVSIVVAPTIIETGP